MDGDWQLVAGAFSSDAGRNARSGDALNLDPARVYGDVHALIAGELALPVGERIDALAIVTPNHLHAPMAIAALNAGIHVFCEKPMAMNGDEARAIAAAAKAAARSSRWPLPIAAIRWSRRHAPASRGANWARSGWCRSNICKVG